MVVDFRGRRRKRGMVSVVVVAERKSYETAKEERDILSLEKEACRYLYYASHMFPCTKASYRFEGDQIRLWDALKRPLNL